MHSSNYKVIIFKNLASADSLKTDHETKKELDSMSSLCLDQLKSIREKHSGSISDIRNRAEHCLRKDYLVCYLGIDIYTSLFSYS